MKLVLSMKINANEEIGQSLTLRHNKFIKISTLAFPHPTSIKLIHKMIKAISTQTKNDALFSVELSHNDEVYLVSDIHARHRRGKTKYSGVSRQVKFSYVISENVRLQHLGGEIINVI